MLSLCYQSHEVASAYRLKGGTSENQYECCLHSRVEVGGCVGWKVRRAVLEMVEMRGGGYDLEHVLPSIADNAKILRCSDRDATLLERTELDGVPIEWTSVEHHWRWYDGGPLCAIRVSPVMVGFGVRANACYSYDEITLDNL